MYGAKYAYEISPSFDIAPSSGGFVTKVPTFGDSSGTYDFTTNSGPMSGVPAAGVAYHF